MTTIDDDDRGGYGRPPKHSGFKKGQSGNSKPVVDLLIKKAIQEALGGCPRYFKILIEGSGRLAALIEEQKRVVKQG